MARSIKALVEIQKNRLKRRSGKIATEIAKSFILIMTTALVAAVMVFLYNVLITAPYFKVDRVTVRGCQRLTDQDVRDLAAVGHDQNILLLKPREIAKKVANNSWVKTVSIGRELPDGLVVEIVERTPSALRVIKGSLYVMDTTCEVFKKLEPQDDVQVPLLNGCHRNGKIDDALVRKALTLLEHVASRGVFPMREQVSEIYADTRYGFSIFTNQGLCFQLGFGNYEKKFARLTPVLRDLAKRRVDTAYLKINLSDRDAVVVRQKDAIGRGGVGKGYST